MENIKHEKEHGLENPRERKFEEEDDLRTPRGINVDNANMISFPSILALIMFFVALLFKLWIDYTK